MADIWNIGGALLGGLLGGQDSKTSQTTTNNPYAPAQPWINANIGSGQRLQGFYQANPLSPGQIGAFANSFAGTNNFRNSANSLVGQMNNAQSFDRTNPLARPAMFNFSAPASADTQSVTQGLLAGQPNAFGASPGQMLAARAAYFGDERGGNGPGVSAGNPDYSLSEIAKGISDFSRFAGYISPTVGYLGGLLSDSIAANNNANYSNEGRNYSGGNSGNDGGGRATGGNNGDASGGGDRGTRGGW